MKKDLLAGLAAKFIGENAVETQAATDAEKAKQEEAAAKAVAETAEAISEQEEAAE